MQTLFTGIYPLDQILPVRFQFSQALEVAGMVAQIQLVICDCNLCCELFESVSHGVSFR
jgi:hypothetical protein